MIPMASAGARPERRLVVDATEARRFLEFNASPRMGT
jgi:hypothetical protein